MVQPGYIGVFDSGVGGISVLRYMTSKLPHERFVFYGDSANAPYGEKSPEWLLERSRTITAKMVDTGAKAVVIACNTATAAAATTLREEYPDIPIIGIEPAVKPAVLGTPGGKILVMATPVTIQSEKFHRLVESCSADAEIIPLSCPGLADFIESGDIEGDAMLARIDELLGDYIGKVDSVVLGCTHYPFVAGRIREVLGKEIPLYDGGFGTARQLEYMLAIKNILAIVPGRGEVEFFSSDPSPERIERYRHFHRLLLR